MTRAWIAENQKVNEVVVKVLQNEMKMKKKILIHPGAEFTPSMTSTEIF